MHWGCDSEESKCSLSSWSLGLAGREVSRQWGDPGMGVMLGSWQESGVPDPITLRTCKPWKDPITSQTVVLS